MVFIGLWVGAGVGVGPGGVGAAGIKRIKLTLLSSKLNSIVTSTTNQGYTWLPPSSNKRKETIKEPMNQTKNMSQTLMWWFGALQESSYSYIVHGNFQNEF